MQQEHTKHRHLLKYFIASLSFFLAGSMHGVWQLYPPVRAWLDSIGSPYGGPGHLIDPLAHAHINLIGGLMMFLMGLSYYLIPKLTGRPVWSSRLMTLSFWGTVIGVLCFYSTLMIFGAWMGELLLDGAGPARMEEAQAIYGPLAAISAAIMGTGLWMFLGNALTSLIKAAIAK
ncbi:MAG TPA: cytochrome oxidase [Candidatus Tenderia sp.]|nr:cytochrome oxidase [Candidatus Tenderia sp.]